MIDPKRLEDNSAQQIYIEAVEAEDQKILRRLYVDFRYFAARAIWIVDKEGNLVRFHFNDAQEYYHFRCEDMLKRTGYVRMIVLKGRQQGLSTYIVARSYWIALTREYKTVCIMAHDDTTAGILFKKVEIFRDNTPEPMKPDTEEDNRKALKFPNKSNFYVITAGSGQAGRGTTAQVRHESERALYKKKEDIDSGVGQNVADVPGTEVHRESTAYGFNHFQKEYTQAVLGIGIFEAVFIPWYWQNEYRRTPRADFQRTDEEHRIAKLYGLSDDQLQWRRDKIAELDDIKIFKREYPLNDVEAFQMSGDSHFDTDTVMAARKSKIRGVGPVIISCDPAGSGDRTVIALRRGREFFEIKIFKTMNGPRLIGILANLIDEYDAVKCFIDAGYGHDVVDGLKNKGYKKIVEGVHFNAQPFDTERFGNKRAEMLFALRDWFRQGEVRVPNGENGMLGDDISQDLAAIPEADANTGVFRFPPKKKIKKDFGRSPDICDAMILSFAYPVREKDIDHAQNRIKQNAGSRNGSVTNAFGKYRKRVNNSRRYRGLAA